MEVKYLGHSSFEVTKRGGPNGNLTVVTDPFDGKMVGLPFKKGIEADLVLISHNHGDHNFTEAIGGTPYIVAGPGEYEVKGVKVTGVASFHDDRMGAERGKNVVYKFEIDGVSFCHLGDLGHIFSEKEVEEIGKVDVLFVPVGGFYTIDPKKAVEVITQLEPLLVIPMHYRVVGLAVSFDKLATVEDFVKEIGKTSRRESVLKVDRVSLPQELEIVVLEIQK